MKIRMEQLVLSLGYREEDLPAEIAKALSCPAEGVLSCTILRRSIDARPLRGEPVYVLVLDVVLSHEQEISTMKILPGVVVKPFPEENHSAPPTSSRARQGQRVLVVGAGPAGLLAAHTLASAGFSPVIIERGEEVDQRTVRVQRFWQDGTLNPESNALFGEGGAGTFSDGKLTTRSKDRLRIKRFLDILISCGAEESIRIDAEPHLGSNRLPALLRHLREEIIRLGGEFHFSTKVVDLQIEDGRLQGVVIESRAHSTQEWPADSCILATGHSARDMYELLQRRGLALAPKPFGVGVRIEIPQMQINLSQYGLYASHPKLSAATLRLTRKGRGEIRNCYTFCMCPGGEVIACSSEAGALTTNGMSLAERNEPFGNAGFLVPVEASDLPDDSPGGSVLAGVEYQRKMEVAAFLAAGSDYSVPAMRLHDFLTESAPRPLEGPLHAPRHRLVDLATILPSVVTRTLRSSIPAMLAQTSAVKMEDVVVYGPETRSSAPVRMQRNESLSFPGVAGLYPAGEGAGYAGGIVSSALDGMKVAEAILSEER